jgi:hypothetical protein
MRQKRTFWGFPLVAAALLVASACADQAEGERCDPKNGDADCSSGLVCTVADKLNRAEPSKSALCCPSSNATADACQLKSGGTGLTDAGRRPDGATPVTKPDTSVTPSPEASPSGDARSDAP